MTLPRPLSSIPDTVTLLLTQPAPVIFLDTCSILDVPRSFYREQASSDVIPRTIHAIHASRSALPQVHIRIPERVDLEYTKNLPETLMEMNGRLAHFAQISRALSTPSNSLLLENSLKVIEQDLIDLTDQIYQSSLGIASDPICTARGSQRRLMATAPGTRGVSNDADCIIIEHVFEVVRQLRASGFGAKCIFVSSNHRDFGRAPNPKPPIDAEFAALKIDFMGDIGSAMIEAGV